MSSRPQTVQGRIESGLREAAIKRSQGSLVIQQSRVKPGSAGIEKIVNDGSFDTPQKAAVLPLSARYARPRTCGGSNGNRTYGLAHRRALGLDPDAQLPTMPTCFPAKPPPPKGQGEESMALLSRPKGEENGTEKSQTLSQAVTLQRYDDELLRTIFGLREHRDELDTQIAQEEVDKAEIERHITELATRLDNVNAVLKTKTDIWKDHDRTLRAMEGAHKNITDSCGTLFHVIKREHVNLAKKHFGMDLSAELPRSDRKDRNDKSERGRSDRRDRRT